MAEESCETRKMFSELQQANIDFEPVAERCSAQGKTSNEIVKYCDGILRLRDLDRS